MVEKSLENVLILEDDAAFVYSDFTSHDSLWQHILANLPASYDMIFLSGFGRHNVGKKITDHIYLGQVSRVASMYMISQKGARNMLRSLPMVSIIDWHMNYAVGKDNEWMKKMPAGFNGPRTVDMQLYHTGESGIDYPQYICLFRSFSNRVGSHSERTMAFLSRFSRRIDLAGRCKKHTHETHEPFDLLSTQHAMKASREDAMMKEALA